jgi:3-hydroxyisobutyrate dehydrogenase-like beta-hydroxyacid dehydrogenase
MKPIGILYPGEQGAAFGRAVMQAGGTIITCLSDRSGATAARATAAAFVVVPSLEEVARRSDLVISMVPPTSAVEVARSFAACVSLAQCRGHTVRPTFVDANSASPRTKQRIAEILSHVGINCLDGAFFGPANRIGHETVFALSGPDAAEIAPLFRRMMEVWVLGEKPGQASALKMAMAIMTKAIPAVFLETVCAASSGGQLDSALDMIRRLYPGILSFLERTLPTYPAHVERRVHELEEAADWLHSSDQRGVMTQAAITVLERFRHAELEPSTPWSFNDLLHRIAQVNLLSA